MSPPIARPTTSNALMGAAGVHFVVSELCRRGLIALPTTRNTPGLDVIVVSRDGSWHANLQVKTSKRKVSFWLIGKHYSGLRGPSNYFVFVRYLEQQSTFEVFLESAANVAEHADKRERRKLRRGTPGIGPSWHLPKDEAEREMLRTNWLQFGNPTP